MNTQAKQLLQHLWREGAYAFFWHTPGRRSIWFPTHGIPDPYTDNLNFYFGVNPVSQIPTTNYRDEPRRPEYVRSQLRYIEALNCLFAEFDGDKAELWAQLQAVKPRPSVIVDSGGGYHAYWLLRQPLVIYNEDMRDYVRKLQWRWVQYLGPWGSDTGVKDLCRVLRLPGTRNYKDKYAPNFPLVQFVRFDMSTQYTVAQLIAHLPPEKPQHQTYHRRTESTEQDAERALQTAERMIADSLDGEKHTTLLKAARLVGGYVGSNKLSEHEARRALQQAIDARGGLDSQTAAYATIDAGLRYGEAAPL